MFHLDTDKALVGATFVMGVPGAMLAQATEVVGGPYGPLVGASLTVLALWFRDRSDARANATLKGQVAQLQADMTALKDDVRFWRDRCLALLAQANHPVRPGVPPDPPEPGPVILAHPALAAERDQ